MLPIVGRPDLSGVGQRSADVIAHRVNRRDKFPSCWEGRKRALASLRGGRVWNIDRVPIPLPECSFLAFDPPGGRVQSGLSKFQASYQPSFQPNLAPKPIHSFRGAKGNNGERQQWAKGNSGRRATVGERDETCDRLLSWIQPFQKRSEISS